MVPRLLELKASIPAVRDSTDHKDVLGRVTLPLIDAKIELLIGADVPEAHRTLEYCVS